MVWMAIDPPSCVTQKILFMGIALHVSMIGGTRIANPMNPPRTTPCLYSNGDETHVQVSLHIYSNECGADRHVVDRSIDGLIVGTDRLFGLFYDDLACGPMALSL
eukprot:282671_1